MDADTKRLLAEMGAVFDGDGRGPLHFGDPAAELRAALDRAALIDRGGLGRLRAGGPDLLALLNRLSTGKVDRLAAGDGAPTVVTTAKGRIVERVFVHRLGEDDVLLVCGAGAAPRVVEHLTRYTFAERTGIEDVTDESALVALVGPRAADVLAAAGLPVPAPFHGVPAGTDATDGFVLGEDGLSSRGFAVFHPTVAASGLWRKLAEAVASCGGRPAGAVAADAWRILSGLPATGHELTDDYNPLEAGLREAVSFDKGCYVGQEVVARLNTYDKVSRSLVGLRFEAGTEPPPPGTPLYDAGAAVGTVTSAVTPPGWPYPVALAYVKRKTLDAATPLAIGDPGDDRTVRVVPLPFDAAPAA